MIPGSRIYVLVSKGCFDCSYPVPHDEYTFALGIRLVDEVLRLPNLFEPHLPIQRRARRVSQDECVLAVGCRMFKAPFDKQLADTFPLVSWINGNVVKI
jgi:hypothetical protein